MQHFFIGVDGGATKCIVRVEDETGRLLGREMAGPANIRISVAQTWQSIEMALGRVLQPLGLSLTHQAHFFHAGMGLAGCEIAEAYQEFLNYPHRLNTLKVTSDAHIACLGAHQGRDGAIIIAGTGAIGFQIVRGKTMRVGGWGFPHDDEGGGAWLGLSAVKATLQWLDQRAFASGLTRAVHAFFGHDQTRIVDWANHANSTAFALLAPLVIEQAQLGDEAALQLLQQAALAIQQIGLALERQAGEALSCAFLGGVAPFLLPYLEDSLRARIQLPEMPPDAGAIFLIRQGIYQ